MPSRDVLRVVDVLGEVVAPVVPGPQRQRVEESDAQQERDEEKRRAAAFRHAWDSETAGPGLGGREGSISILRPFGSKMR